MRSWTASSMHSTSNLALYPATLLVCFDDRKLLNAVLHGPVFAMCFHTTSLIHLWSPKMKVHPIVATGHAMIKLCVEALTSACCQALKAEHSCSSLTKTCS